MDSRFWPGWRLRGCLVRSIFLGTPALVRRRLCGDCVAGLVVLLNWLLLVDRALFQDQVVRETVTQLGALSDGMLQHGPREHVFQDARLRGGLEAGAPQDPDADHIDLVEDPVAGLLRQIVVQELEELRALGGVGSLAGLFKSLAHLVCGKEVPSNRFHNALEAIEWHPPRARSPLALIQELLLEL